MIDHIKYKLHLPLPGFEAQAKMAHGVRRHRIEPPENARLAGVMALFYPRENIWYTVFIQRPSRNPKDAHSGQISFPGGQFEEQDTDLAESARRETFEEIGVPQEEINLLGKLTKLYIPVSNFLVQPYIGYAENTPKFIPEPGEVDDIIEVPVHQLTDPDSRQFTEISLNDKLTLRDVPHFNVNGKVIWGATAMILSELIELLPSEAEVR